jgi:hypothetical protein
MPGLLRGIARTAVVAGTATAVSNRVSRRQASRWAADAPPAEPVYQQQPVYAPPPAAAPPVAVAAPPVDRLTALQQLGDLKQAGILTDAEFAAEKARILAS